MSQNELDAMISSPSPGSKSLNLRSNRNATFYLLIASLFLVSLVIYLCSTDYKKAFRLHTIYGPVARIKSDEWLNPRLWNTERDAQRDSSVEDIIDNSLKFDLTSDDVMVFLHIQNTGGNVFGRHLVEDLVLDRPCVCKGKRCRCLRPNGSSQWLFSRQTVGWKCGVHPDFNELMHCTDRILDEMEGEPVKRRYFYITLLRDPITRFVSELNHFRDQDLNGKASRHWCGGREVQVIPKCTFDDQVTLDQFLDCPFNLAINRQTRMLSDLALVGCYNHSLMPEKERQLIMLSSAKTNLHKMAFFGLTEFPRISQYLFQETFDMMFLDAETHSFHRTKRSLLDDLDSKTIEKIKLVNHLDMQLYEYAKELLFDRFERLKRKNPKLKDLVVSKVAKDNMEIVNWGDSEDQQRT